MDWAQFVIFCVGVFGLFIWNRTESRADIRHMDQKLDSYRELTRAMIDAIREDIKDFHGRLERQDAEFKGKLALQDAEFKAHFMHHHKE